ncbi:amidohydrolase [Sciscionella marina]|uniref:amidohydrolase n=1 Tax=Sciscionella marina TaxID=508770 RepID=UPI000374DCC0|nr:amidohydrolase [Sciscionella marina]
MTERLSGEPQIVTAAHIHTMTGEPARAFAYSGERILATGELAELRESFPGARVHDFGAATVVPGFNDAHQHPTICAEQTLQVDLSPDRIRDTEQLIAALAERAAHTPKGQWVIGSGYDHYRSGGGVELTRAELDRACPEHPALVVSVTLHAGTVNTAGLRLAGLQRPEDAPPGGELGVGADGELNGVMHDQVLYDLAFPAFTKRETIVPQPEPADLQQAFCDFAMRLHAAGITSAGDALVAPKSWELLDAVERSGRLTLRVNALASYDHFDYFRALERPAPDAVTRLRLGGIKTFADGAVNGGMCLVEEPVIGATGNGIARMEPEEMNEVVRTVHDAGWRVAVHANGDRAVRYVLDAIEAAQQANPRADVRHRLEHTSVLNTEVIKRMAALGAVAVPFAEYALAHGDKLRAYYEPERRERMFAHRALLDAGVPVAGSSDYPCGPYEPLFAMRSCVARKDRTGAEFGPSQRISATEALALFTTGAAYSSAEEHTKGKLAEGQLADFVVLDADPAQVDPDELSEIPVRQTWVGGERVWAADGE